MWLQNIYCVRLSSHICRLRSRAGFHSSSPRYSSQLSANAAKLEFQRRKAAFDEVLPEIVDSFINRYNFKSKTDISTWIKEVLNYNLSGGKRIRGLSTVMAYEAFEKPENITDESLRLSYIAGWGIEMLQAYGLLIDDIMDGAVKRRGVPCWYTLPNVGLGAINDSVLIYAAMDSTIKSHLGHLPHYLKMIDLISEGMVFASAGQHLDDAITRRKKKDYSKFTIEYYSTIANYKTSYAFKMPVSVGLLLANNNDKESHRKTNELCFKIGDLFQMQDDFIDVFELESVTGKFGSDIQVGKCTWLAVTALQRCNDAQRREFISSYGSPDPADVQKIKHLYEDLRLPEIYRQEERTRYEEVIRLANNFGESPRVTDLFLELLSLIYNRCK